MYKKIILSFAFVLLALSIMANSLSVKSPDGRLELMLDYSTNEMLYSVKYDNKVMLEPSGLGVKTNEGELITGLKFLNADKSEVDKRYVQDRIKQSVINYKANAIVCSFENAKKQKINVRFQVSNNDVAFRYELPVFGERMAYLLESERTEFVLPKHATAFMSNMMTAMTAFARTAPSYESGYTNDAPFGAQTSAREGYVFPALFRVGNDGWVLISETGVSSDYCASHLSNSNDGRFSLKFPAANQNNGFGTSNVQMALPGLSPWRTITVGNTLKPIVETTISYDLVDPLYPPSQAYKVGRSTWSWIVWQDPSMNWSDQIKYVDLAAAMGYEYILIDALWDVNIGYDRMKDLIRYAASKNVGVFLWYNSNGGFNDAPQTPKNKLHNTIVRRKEMQWLKEAGVKGLKVDFFGGDKQETMRLYEDILFDANEHGLMIVFHGCTLPRGWERMYPNFVGSEAVLASEMLVFSQYARDNEAFFATLHPFIRNSVASMEFGGVFLNKFLSRSNKTGPQRLTTDAFQLATAILFQSPMQMFALTPNNLHDAPAFAIDFMKEVPTTWDETLLIDGYPGKYVVIARRNKNTWYVSGVNATNEALKLKLDLPMFAGKTVKVINDDKSKNSLQSNATLKTSILELTVQPNGGFVVRQ